MPTLEKRSLRRFHFFLARAQRGALKYPRTVLLAGFLALVLALVSASQLKVLTSIDGMIDTDFTTFAQLDRLKHLFDDKNNVFVAFQKRGGGALSPVEICAVRHWIAQESQTNPGIQRTFSTFSVRQARQESNRVWFPALYSPDCGGPAQADFPSLSKIQSSPYAGIMTSTRGDDLAAEFYLREVTDVKELIGSAERNLLALHPQLRAHWSGTATYEHYTQRGFEVIFILNLVLVVILVILSRVFFGTFINSLILISVLALAGVFLSGIMAALHFPVDVLSSNLFMILSVSTIEDFLFVSYLMLQGGMHWRRTFRSLLLPSFFTSLTTVVGFGSLGISELGIIRRFGAMAAIGAPLEWLIIFFLLPALLTLKPRWLSPLRRMVRPERACFRSIPLWLKRWELGRPAAKAMLLVFPVAIFSAFHLHIFDSPERVFPAAHPFRETYDYLSESRGIKGTASLVFGERGNESANREILRKVTALPEVSRVENPYELEDFVLGPLPPLMSKSFRTDLRESGTGDRLYGKGREARAILYLSDGKIDAVNALRREVSRLCSVQECWLAGALVSYGEFGDRVRSTLLESLVLSLVLVGLILLFLAYQTGHRYPLALVLSAFWGSALTLTVVAVFKVPISFVTSVFGAILVGLTGDNTIQYLFGRKGSSIQSNLHQFGGASFMMCLMMMAIALSFVGSYFAPARILGVLLAGGCFVSFAGDYWLLKGLITEGPNRRR